MLEDKAARPNAGIHQGPGKHPDKIEDKLMRMGACSGMEESQKHGKGKDIKDYILYDFIYRRV